ncbi:hypothetical protein ACFSBZ_16365 [Amnibacterium flavum]|uniref:Uncharacterized protein n=1 Tax=Amnibacterium flavum TaxID=2173173 RepID=A0A2V1HLI3_9MICO|nr:hypothetical protein [Amnibacterium flavum]PVZ93271.1 hypothetical protein DDQ50_16360 [Amnibacterium flavum]
MDSGRARWHPIFAAFEPKAGEWWLRDAFDRPYAIVAIVRRGDEVGYRAVTYAERAEEREVVGYYRRLLPALEAAHAHWIASHGPKGGVNGRSAFQRPLA